MGVSKNQRTFRPKYWLGLGPRKQSPHVPEHWCFLPVVGCAEVCGDSCVLMVPFIFVGCFVWYKSWYSALKMLLCKSSNIWSFGVQWNSRPRYQAIDVAILVWCVCVLNRLVWQIYPLLACRRAIFPPKLLAKFCLSSNPCDVTVMTRGNDLLVSRSCLFPSKSQDFLI